MTSTENTPIVEHPPLSIDQILSDLRGFGIEELEEVLTLEVGGRTVTMKLSNVTTEDDLTAMLAVEGMKNYQFFQQVKIEILSRSVSELNGIRIRYLTAQERIVVDPTDGHRKDIQGVICNVLKTWGLEVTNTLWRVLMAHAQTIENRLVDNFPQAATMTDVERRIQQRIEKELEEFTQAAIREAQNEILDEAFVPEDAGEAAKS